MPPCPAALPAGSVITCPNAFVSLLEGWTRAWIFVYYHNGVRKALLTLLAVTVTLGPFFALTFACFFAHFFIFQALATSEPTQNGFGVNGHVPTAMYNLFGLMTTVNHPDVLMYLDTKPTALLCTVNPNPMHAGTSWTPSPSLSSSL